MGKGNIDIEVRLKDGDMTFTAPGKAIVILHVSEIPMIAPGPDGQLSAEAIRYLVETSDEFRKTDIELPPPAIAQIGAMLTQLKEQGHSLSGASALMTMHLEWEVPDDWHPGGFEPVPDPSGGIAATMERVQETVAQAERQTAHVR